VLKNHEVIVDFGMAVFWDFVNQECFFSKLCYPDILQFRAHQSQNFAIPAIPKSK